MQTQSKRELHSNLVLDMADKMGIDLQEMTLRGMFSEDQMDQAVDKCLGCTQPTACRCLMDSEAQVVNLPNYCRNGDLFTSLKSE